LYVPAKRLVDSATEVRGAQTWSTAPQTAPAIEQQ